MAKAPIKSANSATKSLDHIKEQEGVSSDIALIDKEILKIRKAKQDQIALLGKRCRAICEYLRTKSILIRDRDLYARVEALEAAMLRHGQPLDAGVAQEEDFV